MDIGQQLIGRTMLNLMCFPFFYFYYSIIFILFAFYVCSNIFSLQNDLCFHYVCMPCGLRCARFFLIGTFSLVLEQRDSFIVGLI